MRLPICLICKKDEKDNQYYYAHIGIYAWDSFLVCEKCLKNYNKIFFRDNKVLMKKFMRESLSPYIIKANGAQIKNFPKRYREVGISKILKGTILAIKNESRIKDIHAFNWRRYAKKSLSEIYNERDHNTFYLFLFEFLHKVDEAYKQKNLNLIKKIFKFAEKCIKSKSWYISNAVAVSFYEHITEHPNMEANLKLISKDIILNEVVPLIKYYRESNYKRLISTLKELNIVKK
jgi:hypothetical protein